MPPDATPPEKTTNVMWAWLRANAVPLMTLLVPLISGVWYLASELASLKVEIAAMKQEIANEREIIEQMPTAAEFAVLNECMNGVDGDVERIDTTLRDERERVDSVQLDIATIRAERAVSATSSGGGQ